MNKTEGCSYLCYICLKISSTVHKLAVLRPATKWDRLHGCSPKVSCDPLLHIRCPMTHCIWAAPSGRASAADQFPSVREAGGRAYPHHNSALDILKFVFLGHKSPRTGIFLCHTRFVDDWAPWKSGLHLYPVYNKKELYSQPSWLFFVPRDKWLIFPAQFLTCQRAAWKTFIMCVSRKHWLMFIQHWKQSLNLIQINLIRYMQTHNLCLDNISSTGYTLLELL